MAETDSSHVASMSCEQALGALEKIVDDLEKGDVPLDKSIKIYERGEALKAHCDRLLKAAEDKVEKIRLSREGKPGMHVRLLLRHWEPRLLPLCVALQGSFQSRLMIFDPLAEGWFAGVSWQFALPDNSVCPVMPDAGFWKAAPVVQPPAPVQPPLPAAAAHVPSPLLQHSQAPAQARREALEKMMAEGDRHHGAGAADAGPQAFRPTEPAGLV